jgi:hypothetical protein
VSKGGAWQTIWPSRPAVVVLQENVPDDFLMYVPVTVDLGDNRVAHVRVKVQGPKTELDLPLMPSQPKGIKFNDLDGVLAEVKSVDW